jgi:RNA polymerase sigma-B factor
MDAVVEPAVPSRLAQCCFNAVAGPESVGGEVAMMPVTTKDNCNSERAAVPVDDVELITIVQALPPGDTRREAAYEELVARYRSTVHGCAQRYALNHEMAEDLIQAGYVGLMSAISRFDPTVGCGLLAYARPCILGEIKRHFRDKRWPVRVLRSVQEVRAGVLKAESVLTQRLSRAPTDDEIAEYLRLETAEVREGRHADRAFQTVSLDAPLSGDPDAGTLADTVGTEDPNLETITDMDAVWGHVSELPDREQLLLELRFYGNMTQTQIGERLGISQMHVSRLLAHALDYLRGRILDSA